MINVKGVLHDPMLRTLGNHEIRITTSDTSQAVVEDATSIYSTDENGNYDFVLLEGWHYLEVLFKDTYMCVGDLLVNDATPSPITLQELLAYSTPVEVPSTSLSPFWATKVEALKTASNSRAREEREQIVDELVHVVDVKSTIVKDDSRMAQHQRDMETCGARATDTSLVYSDDSNDCVAVKQYKISNEIGLEEQLAEIGKELLTQYQAKAHGSAEEKYTFITEDDLTHGWSVFKDTTGQLVNYDVSADVYTKTTTSTGSFGETENIFRITTADFSDITEFMRDNGDSTVESLVHNSVESNYNYSSNVSSKETYVTHSNNGTTSRRKIRVDNHIIGREGNDTFEVDNVNDKVYVRGQLVVSGIQDSDGNDITPKDGDTIFQVFQYSDSPSGPWSDELLSHHFWRRQNISVNGEIDDTQWSIPYQFRASTDRGNDGDTIYVEYQYSPDGATNWTQNIKAGDAFRRERTVTNGVPGDWSEVVRLKGDDGSEIEVRSQYSIDGINDWHDVFADGDQYERRARFINGVQDSPWSDPFKIVAGGGAFKSIVFIRSTSQPATPTGGTYDSPIPTSSPTWSDGIPAGSYTLWSSVRTFTPDGGTGQDATWSVPRSMTSTATFEVRYSTHTTASNPGTPSSPWNGAIWSTSASASSNWMATRTSANGVYSGWQVSQIKGEKGDKGEDGENGDNGLPGLNGSGWYSIVNSTGTWPGDASATSQFTSNFGRAPQKDDHLFFVNSAGTASAGKRCTSAAGASTVTWSTPVAYFNGDVIVKGTLSADRLVSNSLTGNEINSQTVILAGSGGSTAGMNGYDGNNLPSWLGSGSNIYKNWRFWAGASQPDFGPFRVNSSGKLWATDAVVHGHIEADSGTFAGDLSAAGGTFEGDLNAAGGTFSGALSAATGSFTGDLSAGSINGLRFKIGSFPSSVDTEVTINATTYEGLTYNMSGGLGTRGAVTADFTRIIGVVICHIGAQGSGTIDMNWVRVWGTNSFRFDRDNAFDNTQYYSYIAFGI